MCMAKLLLNVTMHIADLENWIAGWPFHCCLLPHQTSMSATTSKTTNETIMWPGQPNKVTDRTFLCGQACHNWLLKIPTGPMIFKEYWNPQSVLTSQCTLCEISLRTQSFFKRTMPRLNCFRWVHRSLCWICHTSAHLEVGIQKS